MNRISRMAGRTSAVLVVVLGFAVALSCSDNTEPDSPVDTGGIQAVFTAAADPTTSSVTLQSESQSEANFDVNVVVMGIDDFYGATFKLKLDLAVVNFTDVDASGSLLVDAAVTEDDLQIIVALLPDSSGWEVVISRNDADVDGVAMADDEQGVLALLSFTALRTTVGSPIEIEDLLITTCPAGSACGQLESPDVTGAGGVVDAS